MNKKSWLRQLQGRKVAAWDFCLMWFDIKEDQIEHGFRKQCIALLADVLEISEYAPTRWGTRFETMPDYHQATLFKVLFIHKIINSQNPHSAINAILQK